MKTLKTVLLIFMVFTTAKIAAQEAEDIREANANARHGEYFGNTLNLGIGLGYYGYLGESVPVLHADFEFDVARNFTLAPFINYFQYQRYVYVDQYGYYYYYRTVVPIGIKGFYYFDQLLNLNHKWDIYAAASLGLTIRTTTWEDGYYGPTTVNDGAGPLFLDLHAGAEYHITRVTGIFLDLSTGVSTIGLGIHF